MSTIHSCNSTCYEIYRFGNHFDALLDESSDTKVCPFCHSKSNNASRYNIQASENFSKRCSKSSLSPYHIVPFENYCDCDTCSRHKSFDYSNWKCENCGWSRIEEYPSKACCCFKCNRRKAYHSAGYSHVDLRTSSGKCRDRTRKSKVIEQKSFHSDGTDNVLKSKYSASSTDNVKDKSQSVGKKVSKAKTKTRTSRTSRTKSSKIKTSSYGNFISEEQLLGIKEKPSAYSRNDTSTTYFGKNESKHISLEKIGKKESKSSKGKGGHSKKLHRKTPTAFDKDDQKQPSSEKKGSNKFSAKAKSKQNIKFEKSQPKSKQKLKSLGTKSLSKSVSSDKGYGSQTTNVKRVGKGVSNEKLVRSTVSVSVSAKPEKESKLEAYDHKKSPTPSKKKTIVQKIKDAAVGLQQTSKKILKDSSAHVRKKEQSKESHPARSTSIPKEKKNLKVSTSKSSVQKKPEKMPKSIEPKVSPKPIDAGTEEKKKKLKSYSKVDSEKNIFEKTKHSPVETEKLSSKASTGKSIKQKESKKGSIEAMHLPKEKQISEAPPDKSIEPKEQSLKENEKKPSKAKALSRSKSKDDVKIVIYEEAKHLPKETETEKKVSAASSHKSIELKEQSLKSNKKKPSAKALSRSKSNPSVTSMRRSQIRKDHKKNSSEEIPHSPVNNEDKNKTVINTMDDINIEGDAKGSIFEDAIPCPIDEESTAKCTCSAAKHESNVVEDNVSGVQPTKPKCTCVEGDSVSGIQPKCTCDASENKQPDRDSTLNVYPDEYNKKSDPLEIIYEKTRTSLSMTGERPLIQRISENSSNDRDSTSQISKHSKDTSSVGRKPSEIETYEPNETNTKPDTQEIIPEKTNTSLPMTCSDVCPLTRKISKKSSNDIDKVLPSPLNTKLKCTTCPAKHNYNAEEMNASELPSMKSKCTCKHHAGVNDPEKHISDADNLSTEVKNSRLSFIQKVRNTLEELIVPLLKSPRISTTNSSVQNEANEKSQPDEDTVQTQKPQDLSLPDKAEISPSKIKPKCTSTKCSIKPKYNEEGNNVSELQSTKPKCTTSTCSLKHKYNVEGDNASGLQSTKPTCTCGASEHKQHKEDIASETNVLENIPEEYGPKEDSVKSNNIDNIQTSSSKTKSKCACFSAKQSTPLMENPFENKTTENKRPSFLKETQQNNTHSVLLNSSTSTTSLDRKRLSERPEYPAVEITISKSSKSTPTANGSKVHDFLQFNTSAYPVSATYNINKNVKNPDSGQFDVIPSTNTKIVYPVIGYSRFRPIKEVNDTKIENSGTIPHIFAKENSHNNYISGTMYCVEHSASGLSVHGINQNREIYHDICTPSLEKLDSESAFILTKRRLETKIIQILTEDEESTCSFNEELKVLYLNRLGAQRCSNYNLYTRTTSETSCCSSVGEKYSQFTNRNIACLPQYSRKVYNTNSESSSCQCSSETLCDRSSAFEKLRDSLIREIAVNIKMLEKMSQSEMSQPSERSSAEDFWSAKSYSNGSCSNKCE